MWQRGTSGTLLILAPLVLSFAIALDIYVPSVPHLVGIFHTTPSRVQLTLSLFMSVMGLGQLIFGPLSDQWGRRKIVIMGLFLFVMGSGLCAIASSITLLILFRVLQAMGACAMMVAGFAIVRDVYDERHSARIYSFLNGAIAISPLLAPFVGAYLDVYYGWRASFVFVFIFGVMIFFIILLFLQESMPSKYRKRVNWQVFKRYGQVLKNLQFIVYAFSAAAGVACFFAFFSLSSYILIQLLHVPEKQFGFYFGVLGITLFLGSLICARLVIRIGVYRTLLFGSLLLLFGGIVMVIWNVYWPLSRASFILPMLPIGFGAAFMVGASAAGALAPFAEMAGTAAAVLGCSEFLLASLAGSIVMKMSSISVLPYAVMVVILALMTLCGCSLIVKKY